MGKFKQFITENNDIDYDDIEEIYEDGDDIIEEDNWNENDKISESLKRKKVVRGGKVIIKKKSTKKGYKIVDGKEVKMSPIEIRTRKIAQKKGAKKRKAKSAQSARKRKISVKRRKTGSLDSQ